MFKLLYDKLMSSTQGWNLSASGRQEFRDFPSAGMAAEMRIAPSALMQLRLAEAQIIRALHAAKTDPHGHSVHPRR